MTASASGSECGVDAQTARGIVESRSIDYVPWKERHGKVWHQGPFWFASNFVLFTLTIGFTGPLAGLGFGWSAVAIVSGVAITTFFGAFHANQGPGMGIPQMIQSRAQFGTRGVIVALLPALMIYIGYNVFNVAIATQGFKAVGGTGPDLAWYIGFVVLQALIAVVGYDMIHVVQRWLTYLLIAAFTVLSVGSVIVLGGAHVLRMGHFGAVGFFSQFVASAGFELSFAIYVSDYSRYLPADVRPAPMVLWTAAGAALSAIWLMLLGALFAQYLPHGATVTSVLSAGNLVAPGFGSVVMVLSSIALLTIAALNTYGATLVSITALDGFSSFKPSRTTRVRGTVLVSLSTLFLVVIIPGHYQGILDVLLTLILYFLIPWSAINLVDYYFVRHGRYAVNDIFNPDGIYGRWAWRGLTAYLIGFLAMTPFFVLPFYTGIGARALGGIDISFFFGVVVSGLLYYLLARSIDHESEDKAYRRSLAILEPESQWRLAPDALVGDNASPH